MTQPAPAGDVAGAACGPDDARVMSLHGTVVRPYAGSPMDRREQQFGGLRPTPSRDMSTLVSGVSAPSDEPAVTA